MQQFRFPLNTVLDYKQQVLDALRAEHGSILAQLRQQEAVLESIRSRYAAVNEEFRERKATGMTIADAMGYESGLRVLDRDIRVETARLEQIKQVETAKRAEVVEARKDTASLEKLKEKKLEAYHKAEQKSEEAFIDELVSASRAMARQARAGA